jgi:hypothetical protein
MHFIIAAAMVLILRRYNSPGIFSWLAPLGVAAVFLRPGLRPEGLAVALTMAGYALLIYCRTAGFRCWTAFFFMFLGASTAPRTAFFSAALAGVGGWDWIRSAPGNKLRQLRFWALAGSGLAAAAVVFLVLIQFRLKEFVETFRLHSAGRIDDGTLYLLRGYLGTLDPAWIAILWLAFVVLCISIRRPTDNLSRMCYCLAVVFVLMGLKGVLGYGSSWFVIFILFLLGGSLVKRFTGMWGKILPWTVGLLLLMANSGTFIGAFGQLTGKIAQKPPENLETIRRLRSTPEQPLLLDGSVARYAFDYRLPAGCIDFEFAAPFPALMATATRLRDEDLFLLSPGTVETINGKGNCYFTIDWWNVFGVESWSQLKNPRQVYLIPARNLKRKAAAQTVDMSGATNPK